MPGRICLAHNGWSTAALIDMGYHRVTFPRKIISVSEVKGAVSCTTTTLPQVYLSTARLLLLLQEASLKQNYPH